MCVFFNVVLNVFDLRLVTATTTVRAHKQSKPGHYSYFIFHLSFPEAVSYCPLPFKGEAKITK
jgi:hypothetical protein